MSSSSKYSKRIFQVIYLSRFGKFLRFIREWLVKDVCGCGKLTMLCKIIDVWRLSNGEMLGEVIINAEFKVCTLKQ